MSIFHYFSKDADKRARFVFNFIAGFYKKIDFSGSSHYLNATSLVNDKVGVNGKTILDVGTGTGDWGAMFSQYEAGKIVGVDFAEKMVANARSKHKNIEFKLGNAEDLSSFEDDAFDIVTASFVVHGVKHEKRAKMLAEMRRVAKSHVVLHDFLGDTPLFIKILEFLEQSDYLSFKKNIIEELKLHFTKVETFQIKKGTGLYICS